MRQACSAHRPGENALLTKSCLSRNGSGGGDPDSARTPSHDSLARTDQEQNAGAHNYNRRCRKLIEWRAAATLRHVRAADRATVSDRFSRPCAGDSADRLPRRRGADRGSAARLDHSDRGDHRLRGRRDQGHAALAQRAEGEGVAQAQILRPAHHRWNAARGAVARGRSHQGVSRRHGGA